MHKPRLHGRNEDAANIRKRVTRMLKAGRVTTEEAERVFAAADAEDSAELERAVGEIRSRHVRARLDDDVRAGRMTEKEADRFIERIRNGEQLRPPSRFRRRSQPEEGARTPEI